MRKGWRNQPARHSLAARGVRTSQPKCLTKAVARSKSDRLITVKVPPLLYHGTGKQNVERILREGFLVDLTPNPMTTEMGHEDDTFRNVSFANNVTDAVFFSLGSAGWKGDQAIFEIDAAAMPDDVYHTVGRRQLFGKAGRYEYKVYTETGVSPEFIKRILLREHVDGVMSERWVTPEEYLAEIRR